MSLFSEDQLYSEDFDNVCRLCLFHGLDNTKIFGEMGVNFKLQDKLFKQFNLWVRPDERIPKSICKTCLIQVETFHNYSLKVEAVQKKLQQVLLQRLVPPSGTCSDNFTDNVNEVNNLKYIQMLLPSNTSTGTNSVNMFPPDFDAGLVYNFRESLPSIIDYQEQVQRNPSPQPVLVNNASGKIQASTSKTYVPVQDSTEIEVEVDPSVLQNYGGQSNETCNYEEEVTFREKTRPFNMTSIGNKLLVAKTRNESHCQENMISANNVSDSDDSSNHEGVMDDDDMSQKQNSTSSYVEESNSSNDSHSNPNDDKTKSSSPKSEHEEFIEHPFRWSKKRPYTKARLDRSKKSQKIKEQLDAFFEYVCNDCEEKVKFTNFLLLRNHCRDNHSKKAYVTCCKRKLTDRKALIHHMLTQHLQPDEFSCPQCGKSVSTQHMLKLHIINHLPESERPYKCSQCGKGFCSIAYVRKHEKSHHFIDEPVGTFICDECGKSFIYERKLYVHKRNLHTKVENPVMCHICAKTFKHQSALRSHLMTHKEGRTEECPYCHKFFKNTDTVRSHIKQEHRVTPAQCQQCDKTFRSKRKLVCHTKVFHSTDKPYQCNICNKYFKLKSGLKTHMVQHTGEKPYQCPYCNRTFASSGNWSTHKKRMHGEVKSMSSYVPQIPRN